MLIQQNRVGQLTTPLGENVLALVQFHGQEGLSELFEFEIEALSEDEDIDFDKILGRGCAISMNVEYFGKRFFHGLLTSARWLGMRDTFYLYRLTIRPWLWLLGKTTDCKIFHDKTVLQIVEEVFKSSGFSDYRLATTDNYPVLHYTVQYRETSLNFVSRLMEQHGIYYFFEHEADKHMLVLADSRSSHLPAPNLGEVVFSPLADTSRKSRQPHLFDWHSERAFRSGKFELNDYHHVTPNARMIVDKTEPSKYAHGDLEIFEHPGPYLKQGDGAHYVKVCLEAEQAGDRQRAAGGLAVPLFPGSTFDFVRHPRASENGIYLVTHLSHSLRPQQYRSNADADENPYKAEYRFLKLDQPFRAPMVTEKPLVQSLQTALVTGQSGEEIDCDDHGRILVHFYWDRHNDKSCRVRVNQVWGAKGWGAQVIPRIGMEVMVAYIDGDPDRPIVVGTVPDPQNNRVPYSLPDKKTKMVFRSDTHKGPGYNELTFEDQNGQQNLFMHAEKDHTVKTRNNHTHRVDANSVQSVGANHSLQIANNMSHQVGGGVTQIIGLPPQANAAVDAAQAMLLKTDSGAGMAGGAAALAQSVAGMVGPGILNQLITQMHNTVTGVAKTEEIGVSSLLNVGQTFNTNVGKTMTIVVGERFEIVVGKSRLIMDSEGNITVLGVTHTHNASGPIQMNGKVIDLNP